MLKVNVDVNLTKIEYPIYFDKQNKCVACGDIGSLTFVNVFGKECDIDQEVHAFDHIKCKSCGAIYSMKWDKDRESGKLIPTAIDPSIKNEFVNLIMKNKIKENGEKKWLD